MKYQLSNLKILKRTSISIIIITATIIAMLLIITEHAEALTHDDLSLVPITRIVSYDGIINVQWEKIDNPTGTTIVAQYGEGDLDRSGENVSWCSPTPFDEQIDQSVRSIDIEEKLTVGQTVNVRLEVAHAGVGSKYPNMDGCVQITVSGNKRNINNCDIKLNSKEYSYTGRNVTPAVTVSDGYKILQKGKDYSLDYYDNDKAGTGTIIVYGEGHYNGETSRQFIIKDKRISLKKGKIISVKAGKKKATVKVAKITNADTYQFAYKKKGGSFKYKYSTSRKKVFKKLKSKKLYYFKVRGVHYTTDGKVIRGKWSALKRVKIK